ncbi:MAG: hypothetical protein IK115_00265 [Lachnospiraceae bacterium]|nr:hypothetical protein [Lachnospiraceae bacterium]
MKKKLNAVLGLGLAVVLAGCGGNAAQEPAAAPTEAAAPTTAESKPEETKPEESKPEEGGETDPAAESQDGAVMSYADFAAAAVDSEVTVETYVQAKQGWWEKDGVGGVATFYTQNEEGGYFLYDMPCSEEDYAKLTEGTKIKVTGYKSEWSGEVEIVDATYEIEEGSYIATAEDITDKLGTDALTDLMNRKISAKGLTVADKGDGKAFFYNWDGSGEQGSDLYFDVTLGDATYTFTVESYLCGADTEVYKAVEGLQVGDTIDVEGFLYWYEGAQPHITSVTVK